MAYIPSGRFNGKNGEVSKRVYISSQIVLYVVNEYFETTTEQLIKKCRKREIVWPRQVAMYFMAYYTVMPLKAIGVILGGKDHTTVIHAVQTVNDLQQSDPLVKDQIDLLTKKLDGYVKAKQEPLAGEYQQYPGNA